MDKSEAGGSLDRPSKYKSVKIETKKIHDVFSMGSYRVDLVSLKEKCYAEIYGHGNPAHGPNLVVPLEIKEPCFVRRQVSRLSTERTGPRPTFTSPLGGAHIFRQKDASSELLVTMLIGESIASNGIDDVQPPTSLRCGRKWVFLSVRDGIFRVSPPKISENGFCALRAYVDQVYGEGFDQVQLGEQEVKIPPNQRGV